MTTTEQNSPADLPDLKGAGDKPVEGKSKHPWLAAINDYITLTKPPIILLLLVTAAGGMFLAQAQSADGGLPSLGLMALVWLGGAMASGGANALNHHYDRDIDGVMQRTRQRPVASNRISPAKALIFGITLNVLAFAVLTVWVNWLAAVLTLAATLFYVLVYTRWLKRSTPHNIVIGGAAGAIPPMVGWAAVTGTVELPAVYLFALVFFWTPPHFWALSLLIQKDYERAKRPNAFSGGVARFYGVHHIPLFAGDGWRDTDVRLDRRSELDLFRFCIGPWRYIRLDGVATAAERERCQCQKAVPVFPPLSRAVVRGSNGGRGHGILDRIG